MKHLSKEKKQHLLLVVIGTLIILIGLWFGLISWQQNRLAKLASERDGTRIKLEDMQDTIERASSIAEEVRDEELRLAEAEQQMASGDHYAWVINTIRTFKAKHPNVEIPQYSTILVENTKVLPKFPYQQATLTVAGKAFYHDLGKFVADFENEFPYIRVQNLEIEPAPSITGGYSEKLAFRMDVVALVKPEA
jgi:Tfp pilus assembly protein PilO